MSFFFHLQSIDMETEKTQGFELFSIPQAPPPKSSKKHALLDRTRSDIDEISNEHEEWEVIEVTTTIKLRKEIRSGTNQESIIQIHHKPSVTKNIIPPHSGSKK